MVFKVVCPQLVLVGHVVVLQMGHLEILLKIVRYHIHSILALVPNPLPANGTCFSIPAPCCSLLVFPLHTCKKTK